MNSDYWELNESLYFEARELLASYALEELYGSDSDNAISIDADRASIDAIEDEADIEELLAYFGC